LKRYDIQEFHYITPIDTVPSILQCGILCHNKAESIEHVSIAMPEIQERRKNKPIPGAGYLHDYVNLYIDAHNPMLSKRREQNNEICVLRIDKAILDIEGIIIADRNASSDWVRFGSVDEGLSLIDKERVFSRFWLHNDLIEEWRHKSEKCAEVLVPETVEPRFIKGAYVANKEALVRFQKLNCGLTVLIKSDIFF